ncbi:unnamed protein product [Lepeophtheirus salmonis]|uniref:(salmon louse) hypothetical protein n=1 Tax=Lepeophtheirus salmonis TaxID=72036 RepID=A0A7R8HBU5_LEPSM|nr:unnamed protein product [Lepeophtheirus salmonis]CAF2978058.1 unnamed protein product [Lepeophtheirus salmonis]
MFGITVSFLTVILDVEGHFHGEIILVCESIAFLNNSRHRTKKIFNENFDSELEGEDGWRRVACDAKSSYAWKIQGYTGKLAQGHQEKNQGMRVVLDLTEGLRGHNVTCDNFFTSYQLGQQLLKRKITMLGTVRKNMPELPPALLALKDTLHRDGSISDRDDRKPIIIMDYNRNKGGVDNLDMREINPTWMSHKSHKRRVFLEQLGKVLVVPLIERRPNRGLSSDCESFSECWTSGST